MELDLRNAVGMANAWHLAGRHDIGDTIDALVAEVRRLRGLLDAERAAHVEAAGWLVTERPRLLEILEEARPVLEYVSIGRGGVGHQDKPYPDATARKVLGAMHDLGLIEPQ